MATRMRSSTSNSSRDFSNKRRRQTDVGSKSKRYKAIPNKRVVRSQRSTRESTVASSTHDYSRHDQDIDELEDHVIMAIDRSAIGKIGCAYYIARHEVLYCMQDIEHGEPGPIENLKLDIEPTTVVLSPRVENDDTSRHLRRQSSLIQDGDEQRPLPYQLIIRPAADFRFENAINKLCNLGLTNEGGDVRFLIPGENVDFNEGQQIDEIGSIDQQGNLLRIASSLDLENRISIGCAGAVVGYLQRRRASEYLQHDPQAENAYRISRIEMFTLKDLMLINTDTLTSLQIIQSETHPSIVNQGPSSSGSKESLSIYGLFHHLARTPQGKARMRRMFLRPSLDQKVILARHEFISVFAKSENHSICDELSKSLSRIKNMRPNLTSLRKGVERGSGAIRSGVWAALQEFCYHALDVGDMLREVIGLYDLNVIVQAGTALEKKQLQYIGRMICDVVDLEESLEQGRTVVRRGINEHLDGVKDAYNTMEDVLARIATEITNTMPIHIQERLNVVYLPQLGYHITVPLDKRTKEAVWRGNDTWDGRFKTEQFHYFKNDRMREMDNRWGDLYATICDTEIEISHELAQRVLIEEHWLIEASDFCGELDALLALTHGARQYKLSRPKMVEDNIIDIKGGRHILQEMTVASYVPNDAFLHGADERTVCEKGPSMVLLTGPNYSGKSVYMKQVALIVFMAQIGSFVPADAATLGLTDKIFTRINTAETVSKIQSAFVIDLQQIAWSLKLCTNRSLIIIDEFGKGTDSCDGAGLAAGVLNYLLNLGSESPKVLASTHFHEIFERGDFDNFQNLTFVHMDVHVDVEQGKSQQSHVTYLYNLREGRSTLSYGNQCAAMNGIPRRIVEKASLLADLMIQGEDLVATCATLPQAEVEELEDAEAICRTFLEKDLGDESADMGDLLEELCALDVSNESVGASA